MTVLPEVTQKGKSMATVHDLTDPAPEAAAKLATAVPAFAPALASWLDGLGFREDARRLCPDLELVPS